jgi:uncharacterized protein YndB with AHSA1/START domain
MMNSARTRKRRTDSASRLIQASPQTLYRAFLDSHALVSWLLPQGMTGRLDLFDPREGGHYRMTLTYEDSNHAAPGKTSEHADVVEGQLLELVPDGAFKENDHHREGREHHDPADDNAPYTSRFATSSA